MSDYRQKPGEKINYRQTLSGDTIVSAVWSIAPTATLDNQVDNTTESRIRVSNLSLGLTYELVVILTTAAGQTLHGCTTVRCVLTC